MTPPNKKNKTILVSFKQNRWFKPLQKAKNAVESWKFLKNLQFLEMFFILKIVFAFKKDFNENHNLLFDLIDLTKKVWDMIFIKIPFRGSLNFGNKSLILERLNYYD